MATFIKYKHSIAYKVGIRKKHQKVSKSTTNVEGATWDAWAKHEIIDQYKKYITVI